MPRWPKEEVEKVTHFEEHMKKRMELEEKEIPEQGETFGLPQVQEKTPALLPLSENALHDKIDQLTDRVDELATSLHSLSALELSFKPLVADPDALPYQIQRRRDETELRRALALLASGQLRPRDDESEQIISDAFGELFAMRQLNYDLMQTLTSAYQNGLSSIRRLTDR